MEEEKTEEQAQKQAAPAVQEGKSVAAKKKGGNFGHKTGSFLLHYILPILLSGVVRAFAIFIFISPNKFAPGGTNGVAVLLAEATGWNSGYFLLMVSVPLFFIAFFCLGKKEAIVSTMSFVVSSGILMLMPLIPKIPIYGGTQIEERIVHGLFGAVAGGVFLGIALAIMLRCFGTSGGTTILASVIHKKFRNLSVSMLTTAFDAIVVFVSIFVYGWGKSFTAAVDPVLLALVSLFVTGKVSDTILHGFSTAYKFEIITPHPEELASEIMSKLRHGVTRIEAEGMYTGEKKSMLVCIIRKRQIGELQKIIRSHPDTFAYFTSTSEVYGRFAK